MRISRVSSNFFSSNDLITPCTLSELMSVPRDQTKVGAKASENGCYRHWEHAAWCVPDWKNAEAARTRRASQKNLDRKGFNLSLRTCHSMRQTFSSIPLPEQKEHLCFTRKKLAQSGDFCGHMNRKTEGVLRCSQAAIIRRSSDTDKVGSFHVRTPCKDKHIY